MLRKPERLLVSRKLEPYLIPQMAQTGTVKEKSRQCCMPVVLTGMFRDAQAWQMYSVENGVAVELRCSGPYRR